MQQSCLYFIVDPNKIEEIFSSFEHKNPFSLKSQYKEYRKYIGKNISDEEFINYLAIEIQVAYKNVKSGDYIYHNGNNYKVAILKFRANDIKSNKGKSGGWRVVALVDEINSFFYLLCLYKHSKGKDNLDNIEKQKVCQLCDEYVETNIL